MLLARLALGPRPALSRCCARAASSTPSSSRWKQRQGRDKYARDAKVLALKSRAAFKLLEGYAPGSWSQVAVDRTRPHGQVVGIDLIPAQPPRGVATFQGDFRSPTVQRLVKEFVLRMRRPPAPQEPPASQDDADEHGGAHELPLDASVDQPSYIDRERHLGESTPDAPAADSPLVDLLLSDMLMNTSGNAFRDHAGSMDLCIAALQFASDTLKPGGHFVCKFYQGPEDRAFERRLKKLFAKVHREKPESSRSESKENFFVALRRKQGVILEDA
ncbi:hypothetical protein G6O67_008671 [Ophiocordyceps sinensis]|uniref:rRNA methyltransferase 2, mitochondrial n=1 Tax=Ophiocordyceps sinensis TaxID=72228 RepID=A0A8H4PFH5_9HYPO|nr:hypothetical protein G6O67_008671 [Ophiocordyceps sinensis]